MVQHSMAQHSMAHSTGGVCQRKWAAFCISSCAATLLLGACLVVCWDKEHCVGDPAHPSKAGGAEGSLGHVAIQREYKVGGKSLANLSAALANH